MFGNWIEGEVSDARTNCTDEKRVEQAGREALARCLGLPAEGRTREDAPPKPGKFRDPAADMLRKKP